MQELPNSNIWMFHKAGAYVLITTNGDVNMAGQAVMGRGTALQASLKFPMIREQLAYHLKHVGNIPMVLTDYRIITVPVKHHWQEDANPLLISESLTAVNDLLDNYIASEDRRGPFFGTKFGCGNGRLDWDDVRPIAERWLDDRFIICDTKTEDIDAIRPVFTGKRVFS